MRLSYMSLVVLVLAGCSDSTGPNLTGSWQYTALGLSKADTACSVTALTLTLSRTSSALSGKSSGGLVGCTPFDVPENLPSNLPVSGTIEGNAVKFDIGSAFWHHTGVLNGNAITGTASFRVLQGTVVTGTFTLVKK